MYASFLKKMNPKLLIWATLKEESFRNLLC